MAHGITAYELTHGLRTHGIGAPLLPLGNFFNCRDFVSLLCNIIP